MNIVFFGTPEFAAETLQFLLEHHVPIRAVITRPDKPKGRSGTPQPTPVKLIAERAVPPIPLFQPERVSDPAFAPILAKFHPDLFVVVAYGEIIKQHLLEMPKLGCINVHPSLLPKYRGATPIQSSLLQGDKVTGVTIMHMVRKMDAGDIISQITVPVEEDALFPEVEKRLREVGERALLEVIERFGREGKIVGVPQVEEEATYVSKIELEDCGLDWSKPAEKLHHLVRAVTPDPGAWCYVKVRGELKRLRVLRSKIVRGSFDQEPGELVTYSKGEWVVACGKDALQILEVQLEGKRVMSAKEFICGVPPQALLMNPPIAS